MIITTYASCATSAERKVERQLDELRLVGVILRRLASHETIVSKMQCSQTKKIFPVLTVFYTSSTILLSAIHFMRKNVLPVIAILLFATYEPFSIKEVVYRQDQL